MGKWDRSVLSYLIGKDVLGLLENNMIRDTWNKVELKKDQFTLTLI